jgi:hypothetical protein
VPWGLDPITGTGAAARGSIAWVRELAPIQRQTAAPDTFGEARPQAFELGDALVNPCGPTARQPGPVRSLRHVVPRQLGELGADLLDRQPYPLREHNESNAANHGACITTMPCGIALRLNQALLLVKAQSGGRNPAALRNLADGQRFFHTPSLAILPLDFKCT